MPDKTPDPPFKRATAQRKAQRSERKGAKTDGGFTTPMSGAGKKKGDYHANGYLVEDKDTAHDSYRIEKSTILKTTGEAHSAGMLPMWRISMPGVKLRVLLEDDYIYLEALANANRT